MIIYDTMLWPYYIFMGVLGLIFGSFANVCICRIPDGVSIVKGRSHCPKCGALIRAYDNIPLLSFILLRGKCRACGEKISFRYPLVELAGAVVFMLAAICCGFSICALIYALFFTALLIVAFIDIDTGYIPDSLVITIAVLALVALLVRRSHLIFATPVWHYFLGAAAVSVPMFLIARFLHGFGYGDVKLMTAAGLLLGWRLALVAFLIAAVTGGIGAGIMLVLKKAKARTEIAFGPYLCLGLILSACFGESIIFFYMMLL